MLERTQIVIAAAATGIFVAGMLWASRSEKHKKLEWVAKPLGSLCFVLLGAYGGALASGWGRVLFAGLILGALGDVLLIPKGKKTFLFGLVAFLLGHVAYAIAFAMRGLDAPWTAIASVVLALLAIPVVRWLWPHVEGPMRVPVAAYVVVITAMVALSAGTFAAHGGALLLIGAVAFYFSDLAVARERFVARGFVNRAWGLPLYYAAQLVLAVAAGDP